MKNKLGIDDKFILEKIELEIVKTKIQLLDYNFTFNKNGFGFDYLIELHKYLFNDIYYFDNSDIRKSIDDKIKQHINNLMKQLLVLTPNEEEKINCILDELWQIQIFNNGNTRTLLAFYKVFISILNIDLDINKINIESGKMFK